MSYGNARPVSLDWICKRIRVSENNNQREYSNSVFVVRVAYRELDEYRDGRRPDCASVATERKTHSYNIPTLRYVHRSKLVTGLKQKKKM